MVQSDGVLALYGQLHCLQMRVHANVDTCSDENEATRWLKGQYDKNNARFWRCEKRDDVDETASTTNATLSPGSPRMVPCTTVPFFSSMVTVSFDSFIRNLQVVIGMGDRL